MTSDRHLPAAAGGPRAGIRRLSGEHSAALPGRTGLGIKSFVFSIGAEK